MLSGNRITKKHSKHNLQANLRKQIAGDQQEVILDVSAGTFLGVIFFWGMSWIRVDMIETRELSTRKPGQKTSCPVYIVAYKKNGMDPMFSNNEYMNHGCALVHVGLPCKVAFFVVFISAGGPKGVATNFP